MQRIIIAGLAAAIALTACSSGESPATPPSADTTTGTSSSAVTVGAGDLFFTQGDAKSTDQTLTFSATAGNVSMTLDNAGATQHDLVVQEADDTKVADAAAGSTDTGTITLTAGTYTLYCNIPGHRDAGMEAVLIVS